MTRFAVPGFIADPPVSLPSSDGRTFYFELVPPLGISSRGRTASVLTPDPLLARWLAHLGAGEEYPTVERVAALLGAPKTEVEGVLVEAGFRRRLKVEMLYFDPVPHEPEARLRYARIARLTYRYTRRYTPERGGLLPSVDDSEPFRSLLAPRKGQELAAVHGSRRGENLANEWSAWHVTWRAMVSRNPCLELRERMRDISEAHFEQSWPFRLERVIDEWLERGTLEPRPLDDRRNILSRAFYERLRELRRLCGGWYYWDDNVGGVVFATRPEWEAKRAGWRSLDAQPTAEQRILPSGSGDWVLGDDARWRWTLRTLPRS